MLQLLHTAVITDFLNIYTLLTLLGVLVLALIVLCFTRGWVGLLAGLVIMLSALGYGAYQGKAYLDSQQTARIVATNNQRVQDWAKSTYNIGLTKQEAQALTLGTEAFDTSKYAGKTTSFGETAAQKTVDLGNDSSVQARVSLFWVKTKWTLVYASDDNKQFFSIPTK